jgi:hypothetical protein
VPQASHAHVVTIQQCFHAVSATIAPSLPVSSPPHISVCVPFCRMLLVPSRVHPSMCRMVRKCCESGQCGTQCQSLCCSACTAPRWQASQDHRSPGAVGSNRQRRTHMQGLIVSQAANHTHQATLTWRCMQTCMQNIRHTAVYSKAQHVRMNRKSKTVKMLC